MWTCWFISTVCMMFFVPLTLSQEQRDWFVFSRDLDPFVRCMEYHLPNNIGVSLNPKEPQAINTISNIIAERFYERSFTKHEYEAAISRLSSYFETQANHLFENNQVTQNIREVIREILEHCVDMPVEPPHFDDEPSELTRVLDFILVDWPTPLQLMIVSAEGRALLRTYAIEARLALDAATSMTHHPENFRDEIRWLWMRRARLYYDGSSRLPYICHGYDLIRRLHTYGNVAHFLARGARNDFSIRNPIVEQSEVNHILNIHAADRPNYVYVQNNIFSHYSTNELNSMRSAEHHIEICMDRFYRILHFTQLLEYDQAIPLNALSIEYQEMLYNNETYRQLLIRERNNLNARLERYGVRSQIEMGLILSSVNVYNRYFSQVINSRYSNLASSSNINYFTLIRRLPEGGEELLCVVLDYILVDWSAVPLEDMIRNRDSRTLLRRYAGQGLTALLPLLEQRSVRMVFRQLIRGMFMRRAQLYFDGRHNDSRLQYIPHRYTIDGRVHVDPDSLPAFYERGAEDFALRNPLVADRSLVNDFLQSHPSNSQDDYYNRYRNSPQTMTTADLFLETQIDQFFRIIYYFNFSNMMHLLSNPLTGDIRILSHNNDYGSVLQAGRGFLRMLMINNDRLRLQIQGSDSDEYLQDEDVILGLGLYNFLRKSVIMKTSISNNKTDSSFTSTTTPPPKRRTSNLGLQKNKKISAKQSKKDCYAEKEECQRRKKFRKNSDSSKSYGYIELDNNFDIYDADKLLRKPTFSIHVETVHNT